MNHRQAKIGIDTSLISRSSRTKPVHDVFVDPDSGKFFKYSGIGVPDCLCEAFDIQFWHVTQVYFVILQRLEREQFFFLLRCQRGQLVELELAANHFLLHTLFFLWKWLVSQKSDEPSPRL